MEFAELGDEPPTGDIDEDRIDVDAGVDRLAYQHGALDHEDALLGTRTAAPREAPQLLDPSVRSAQFHRTGSAGVHR